MHIFDEETQRISDEIGAYVDLRLRMDPVALDQPRTFAELSEMAGQTITADGLGGSAALKLFTDILAPACISTDHPRYLAFIPTAPTELSSLFDLVVGASGIYGGSWLEGAGAVYAENQALAWIASLAGFPATSGGVFMQGGTVGNLSALVTARESARAKFGNDHRWVLLVSENAHSSIASAARVMDVDIVQCAIDQSGRLLGSSVLDAVNSLSGKQKAFAVVATSGSTNLGIIDDLASIADTAEAAELWFHVDGAYGAAALAAPSARPLFDGIERADSFIVDPHKWFFAPFDACALLYRNPHLGKRAHTQEAGYLKSLQEPDAWNPSDFGIQLSRRPRGLPFWYSLASHGTKKYVDAVERTLEVARDAARLVGECPVTEVVYPPALSIVAFRRIGWGPEQYKKWSDQLLADQIGFVTPSTHQGETILRFAIVNPRTTPEDISTILATLA